VDGVAGHSLRYLWVVVVDPSHAVRGWWWWALVTLFVGGGGVPRWFSCAMVHGFSSLWSSLSFDGEGGGLLFVFAGTHHSSWVPVGGCRCLCPVQGGGWRWRSFGWCGCGRRMCVAAAIDDRGNGGKVTASGRCGWWWFGGGKE